MDNKKQEKKVEQYDFNNDTNIVINEATRFVKQINPAYLINSKEQLLKLAISEGDTTLDAFTFYKLNSCMIDYNEDNNKITEKLNEKMSKFFSSIHSLNLPIVYGICSYEGITNLVIGLYDESHKINTLKNVLEGNLAGVDIQPYQPKFEKRKRKEKYVGFVSSIPSVNVDGKKQLFNIAPVMRSLNGKDYTLLFLARPMLSNEIDNTYKELIEIRDNCFAVSKRNLQQQEGKTHSEGITNGKSYTYTRGSSNTEGSNKGFSFVLTYTVNSSKTESENESFTENFSKTVTESVNKNKGISYDIQNGFALELMEYADKAIERTKQGKNNGMWETVISFSADTEEDIDIIHSCMTGEMAKPNADILPLVSGTYKFDTKEAEKKSLIVPRKLVDQKYSNDYNICTALTTEELSLMCSLPTEPVPDFELKRGKLYPLIAVRGNGVNVGCISEGNKNIAHMPFFLSYGDLAKHTFVCGITGSGKTTTVKRILKDANVPFLVIESAKKEYRNIKLDNNGNLITYTLGKPEINCLRINPFYIQRGVSLQTHIDFLKDLFNASFSFYGPMPYILEKCLHTIYQKKGWNSTLGFHPYLINKDNSADLFEEEHIKKYYNSLSHKFLYPTMEDLKNEIKRYIENELQYDGEVAGNIKTAILARLENLCTGAKGYMFNTNEFANMEEMLNNNIVLELEGLADDSDKAFCVGLLLIYINEYRQAVQNLITPEKPLVHLLVIEEAHRLLKNIETERSTEELGNPKGKAVEHFTNMIAEMRSYGQGVIIAEQIPTKLAPDVIKNSSNKIIQRLVASDDQMVMANTVGLTDKEAIYIGNLTTGQALCHKEGMVLPVQVKIESVENNNVSDGILYAKNIEDQLQNINLTIARDCLVDEIDTYTLKILNSILIQDFEEIEKSITWFNKKAKSKIKKKRIELLFCNDEKTIYAKLLTEAIIKYLLQGVYKIKTLVNDTLFNDIYNFIKLPSLEKLREVREQLRIAYGEETKWKGKYIIKHMTFNQMSDSTDIPKTVRKYFICADNKIVEEIVDEVKSLKG